jgi:hypothetical protein
MVFTPRLVITPTFFQWKGVGGENTTNGMKIYLVRKWVFSG